MLLVPGLCRQPAAPEVVPILTAAEEKAAKKKKQDDKEFEVT